VTEYYYPHVGGVTEHVHHFAREVRRRGHSADIITSNIGDCAPVPGVIRIGRSMSVYANGSQARVTVGDGLRRSMRRVLRSGDYDLVHVHSPFSPTLSLLAIDEAECPVVATVHTNFPESLLYRILRRRLQGIANRLTALIAVSSTAAEAHARYIDAEWSIVPNGIDLDAFHPGAERPAALHHDVPSILFVGRFDPRNALGTLIDAFRRVTRRGREARLVVVGDGPLRGYYRRLAGGDRRIQFTGALRDERPGYYAGAAVYACPTTRASFGITLLEAMACATPIVCSDIAGFRDVVEDGREALFVPVGKPAALADALVRLLDDEVLRARLGHAGRQTAAGYSWPAVADRVLTVYANSLGVEFAA
jgi:phosphatidylinositol alpha-mannosyltransferase